jgi:hypothetical protein
MYNSEIEMDTDYYHRPSRKEARARPQVLNIRVSIYSGKAAKNHSR